MDKILISKTRAYLKPGHKSPKVFLFTSVKPINVRKSTADFPKNESCGEKRIPKYLHTIVYLQQKARTMFIYFKLYDKYQELTCQQCDNSGQSAFA